MSLTPLSSLLPDPSGEPIPLPERLEQFYGPLRFPRRPGKPYVITNFVASIDGVVSLSIPGKSGGGEISGFYPTDQAAMGILRACADAVIVGASQLRRPPGTIWLAEKIYPDFAAEYRALRGALGKPAAPLQVVVTGTGEIDLGLPIFTQGLAPVLILTSAAGQLVMAQRGIPEGVEVQALAETGQLGAGQILEMLEERFDGGLYLIEGGPHLVRFFLEERCLDELFLTVAPQIAGRDMTLLRPAFTVGKNFAPDDPRWCRLVGLKQSGGYLFVRYGLVNGYAK